MSEIIQMDHISKQFGGLKAVHDFCGEVEEHSIVGLIGPNGAGKTTLFNMMARTIRPTAGKIYYYGKDITDRKTSEMAGIGLARTFQVTKPFGVMSVLDNIMVGAFLRTRDRKTARKKAEDIYRFLGIDCDSCRAASSSTTVDRKKLEVARALATEPKLLLLDEVMAGCNPQEKLELVQIIRKIRDSGVTVIIIEHDIKTIMSLCEKIFLLDRGEKLVEGTPEEVANDKRAISAYMGEEYTNA